MGSLPVYESHYICSAEGKEVLYGQDAVIKVIYTDASNFLENVSNLKRIIRYNFVLQLSLVIWRTIKWMILGRN